MPTGTVILIGAGAIVGLGLLGFCAWECVLKPWRLPKVAVANSAKTKQRR